MCRCAEVAAYAITIANPYDFDRVDEIVETAVDFGPDLINPQLYDARGNKVTFQIIPEHGTILFPVTVAAGDSAIFYLKNDDAPSEPQPDIDVDYTQY